MRRQSRWTECQANAAYEHYRAHGRMKNGRRLGAPPKPYTPPATPEGRINVTDPDSRVVNGLHGFIQGYNAQAVTNEHQIVIAAEVMTAGGDFGHLEPISTPPRQNSPRPVLPTRRACCSPTPATGTSSRCNTSSTAASKR
jgi:hypothetical protein